MPPLLIGGAISAGTSLIGGILGHNAAKDAAAAQAAAGLKASELAGQAGQESKDAQTSQLNQERQTASPYTNLGSQTAGQLGNLLAPGGALSSGWNQTFSAPTAADAAATPGYQFQLQQGVNALQNSAAARGGLLSTGTAKNLNNYAQGVASTNYQNTYNNALNTYNTNQSSFRNNQNDLFSRLFGTTSLGENAANALNNVTQSGTNNLTGNIMDTAKLQGNDIMGVGNAQASGIVGGANALNAGIGGAANAINQGMSLQRILGGLNASNPQIEEPSGQTYYGPGGS